MELNNYLQKIKDQEPAAYILGSTYLIQALYPFIPHMTSELWSNLPH